MLSIGLATAGQLGSLIVYDLSGTASLAGVPSAIFSLAVAGIAYPAGRFMDRHGRRPGLMLGFLAGGLGAALIAASVATRVLAGYLVGTFVFSVGAGVGMLTRAAVGDMYQTEQRASAVGFVVTGGLVGGVSGPMLIALGDWIAHAIGRSPLAVPWAFVLGAFALAIVAMSRLRPDPRDIGSRLTEYFPGAPGAAEQSSVRQWGEPVVQDASVSAILSTRPARAAMVALACAQATMIMLMATSSLILSLHGHSMGTISLVMMAHVLGMFALSVPVGRLADRIGRRPVLIRGALLSASAGLLFALGVRSALWAAAAFYLVGLGWCLAFVAGAALLGDLSGAATRARVLGVNDLFTNLSAMVAALLGGVLLARGGELTVGILAAILGSAPLVAILRAGPPGVPAVASAPVPADGGS